MSNRSYQEAPAPLLMAKDFPITRLCAFDTREGHFLPLNDYDQMATLEGDHFVAHDARAHRPVVYANHLLQNRFEGVFVFNTCDAAGWDYSALPVLGRLPIFQYCRLRTQRNRVVLVPLADQFMSPKSPNLPKPGYDPQSFRDKRPMVVWRGRMSGTIMSAGFQQHWMKEDAAAVRQGDAANFVRLKQYARYRFVASTQRFSCANIGFVIRKSLERYEKPAPPVFEELLPIIRPRMRRAEQLEYKYLLALEGNDAATSLAWSLAANSVVLMPEPIWETSLTEGLTPWKHYVPVRADGGDLSDVVAMCEAKPQVMERIIRNAHAHMRQMTDPIYRDCVDQRVYEKYLGRRLSSSTYKSLYDFA